MHINLSGLTTTEKQQWLQHIVAPRPIALASTIDKDGNMNLSPFSFFNLFSSHPPIVIFSPARRVRNNTIKDTLYNIQQHPEVVINMVSQSMVNQTSLASCEYPGKIDEFEKAGFTKEKARMVRPPMVKESPAKLECKVNEIKSLGEEAGAGQLVIAEVLCIHIKDELLITHPSPHSSHPTPGTSQLTADNSQLTPGTSHLTPDPRQLNLVARLGANWYCSVNEHNLFEVEKPNQHCGIGFDELPRHIRNSDILTGNQLAQLANVQELPDMDMRFMDERFGGYFFSVPRRIRTQETDSPIRSGTPQRQPNRQSLAGFVTGIIQYTVNTVTFPVVTTTYQRSR